MNNRREVIAFLAVIIFGAAVLVGLTWVNYRYVAQDVGMNDFVPRWAGSRYWVLRGWSPYSEETTQDIQRLVYRRLARPSEDQGYYLYPFYSAILYAPFSMVDDLVLSQALWMTVLEIGLIVILAASVSMNRWRPPAWILILLLAFCMGWYHSVIAVLDGSLVILSVVFLTLSFMAIRAENDVFAGFLLALTSVQPQVMLLVWGVILLWAISQDRWLILWSFLASIFFMVAVTSLFISDWTVQNFR